MKVFYGETTLFFSVFFCRTENFPLHILKVTSGNFSELLFCLYWEEWFFVSNVTKRKPGTSGGISAEYAEPVRF